jgi:hypothetical protein
MSEEKKVEQGERGAFEAHIRDKCESEEYAFLCLHRNSVGLYPTTWVQSEWEGWMAHAASTSANVAQGAVAVCERIARALHYPACWDTASYPTLESAAWEAIACAKLGCSTCGESK